jgi:hypothetical protein
VATSFKFQVVFMITSRPTVAKKVVGVFARFFSCAASTCKAVILLKASRLCGFGYDLCISTSFLGNLDQADRQTTIVTNKAINFADGY